jgi:hypothetical protein
MQRNSIIIFSWVTLVIAILAWAGVVLFAWFVLQMLNNRDTLATSADQAITSQATTARMRALARDTVLERAQLETKAGVDVLDAVKLIEGIASGNLTLRVSNVQEEKVVATAGGTALQAVSMVVDAEGSFAGLMRAVQMLETLPLPTTLQQLDIGRAPIGEKEPANVTWHMNVRLQFLTTAEISS